MQSKTKNIVLMGIFIALSLVGSYIKVPSPFQSIALDAMPAFLAGIILGGPQGAAIGFLGHLLTAANAGFYLTIPIHLLVAVIMAITIFVFSTICQKTNVVFAGIVGIILNGVGAPLIMAFMPQFGWVFFTGITPFLVLASAVNVIIAIAVAVVLQKSGFKGIDYVGR
ncbi:ECF transporter S component [Clostridiaceae bacterium 35-E11]